MNAQCVRVDCIDLGNETGLSIVANRTENSAVITLAYDTKEEAMEWMTNTQLGRRNLPPAQRLAVMDMFKKKIQEQAKENMSIGGSSDKKGSPNGETLIKKQTHTDKELAKMAGVGTGTVARFNKVMNSDDEELKKKVLSGETSISANRAQNYALYYKLYKCLFGL